MERERWLDPETFLTEYEALRKYYYDLLPALEICAEYAMRHKCGIHTGFDKWIAVGMTARKYFKHWHLTVNLNPFFIDNNHEDYGKVFFTLETVWYVDYPWFVKWFVASKGDYLTHKRYTTDEVKDKEVLRKDIGELVEEALVKGKAWEF